MLVKAILESKSREIVTAKPSMTFDEAMGTLIEKGISCLPVVDDNGDLKGIISDRDIFRKIHETKGDYSSLTVGDVMKESLIVGVPEDDASYITGLMSKNWIRHIPIVEDGKLVGLVSQRDIIVSQAEKKEIENRYLKAYLDDVSGPSRSGDL